MIVDEFFGFVGRGPRNNPLDFGGNADHDSDPSSMVPGCG